MTESNFTVNGITCNNCVAKLTKLFGEQSGVQEVLVDKEKGQLKLISDKKINASFVGQILLPYPKYQLAITNEPADEAYSFKPLLMIIGFILLIVVLTQINNGQVDWMQSMRFFMGGFFICFSFFKLLDLDGFATAYQSYDIISTRWKTWGYIYPFVELLLGIAYVLNYHPLLINSLTLLVMGLSSIGVIKAVSSKQKIQCACLGTGFNLPMTTVTIIEDLGMVLMAAFMLLAYLN